MARFRSATHFIISVGLMNDCGSEHDLSVLYVGTGGFVLKNTFTPPYLITLTYPGSMLFSRLGFVCLKHISVLRADRNA